MQNNDKMLPNFKKISISYMSLKLQNYFNIFLIHFMVLSHLVFFNHLLIEQNWIYRG